MAPTPSTSAPSGLPEQVTRFEPAFLLDKAQLQKITQEFKREMKDGLENYGRDTAMVRAVLAGGEKGES